MRYLITILFIVVLATAGILWSLKSGTELAPEGVISVNKRQITSTELTHLRKGKQLDDQDLGGLIDTVITRELLIQEAKRRNIDQEESFRKSLKNFYEQSLIKTIIDQESASFSYTPSPKEIAVYKELLTQKIDITLVPEKKEDQQELKLLYKELTPPLQMAILSLQIGEETKPLHYAKNTYSIRVNSISNAEEVPSGTISDKEAKESITSFRKDDYLKNWLDDLERKANITVKKDKI